MSKVNLQSVLEKLVNEERNQASSLLHQWFVEKCADINKQLVEDVHIHVHGDEDPDDVSVHGTPTGKSPLIDQDTDIEEADEDFDDLNAEDGEDTGNEDLEGLDDTGEEDGMEAEDGGEFNDDEELGGDDLDGEGDEDLDPSELEDQVESLEAELKELKDQLKAFIDDEGEETEDKDVESEDNEDENPDAEADEKGDHEEPDGDEDEDGNEPGEEDKEDEEVEESFDFLDLEEAFTLDKVPDPKLSGNREIGDKGNPVKTNEISPIPQKKPDQRVGGSAVQIKTTQHKGYDMETAPAVSSKTGLKNQVMNAKQDLKNVPEGGDKTAIINKKGDGFGSDSPKSPIGAGAVDLRGNFLKR
jgi:hypothetical protein